MASKVTIRLLQTAEKFKVFLTCLSAVFSEGKKRELFDGMDLIAPIEKGHNGNSPDECPKCNE